MSGKRRSWLLEMECGWFSVLIDSLGSLLMSFPIIPLILIICML